jgi:hypothetical protein
MFMVDFLSGGAGFVNEFKAAVMGHLPGKLFGGLEVVATINRADGFGIRVADIHEPDGDFVAFVVGVGLRAVEENAAPMAGVTGGLGAVQDHKSSTVKDGDFGVWADALQLGAGLQANGFAGQSGELAGRSDDGDDGGAIGDAEDAARLAGILNHVSGAKGVKVIHGKFPVL